MQQSALILPGHDGSGRQGTAALIPHGLILPRMGWAGSFSGYCCFFGEMPGSRARPSRGHRPWVTGRKEKLVTPFPLGDSFLSSGWDPNLHSHGGLRALPWLGMLPVVPSPETLLGITSLPWVGTTGGNWGLLVRVVCSLAASPPEPGRPRDARARSSQVTRCHWQRGRKICTINPSAAVLRAAERSRWIGWERIKLSPQGGTRGRDSPAGGIGTVGCWGLPPLPGEGMGYRVPGASGRYLGAVEVAAVRVREPARPAGALVDGHVPQLNVHPHDAPVQRDGGVSPGGGLPVPPTHPAWPCPIAASGTGNGGGHGCVGGAGAGTRTRWATRGVSNIPGAPVRDVPPWSCVWGRLELGRG